MCKKEYKEFAQFSRHTSKAQILHLLERSRYQKSTLEILS